MTDNKTRDAETSSEWQEIKQKYYKEIEILEAVEFEKQDFETNSEWQKEIFVKDFSKYFDVEIENSNGLKKEIKEFIEDFLYKKLNKINKYWKIETFYDVLNKRIYRLKITNENKNKIIEIFEKLDFLLKEEFNDIKKIKLENSNLLIKNEDNFNIKINLSDIKRKFNCMLFFQDHESLFSQENDFETTEMKALYLNVKDKNWKKLGNIETKIYNLPDKNKFFVKVRLDNETNLKWNKNIEISWYKKYKYVFFTERWNYLKWSLKTNQNKNG